MSTEVTENAELSDSPETPDERTLLMQRARLMGLKVSNNIGLETLKAKIAAHLEGGEAPEPAPELQEPGIQVQPQVATQAVAATAAPLSKAAALQQHRQKLIREATKLVRLRITNLDPKKKDLPGEIFTVGNRFIGTVRKYVPFGEVTENGYHVPNIIYQMMRQRKFLNIKVRKTPRGEVVETSYVPEFALEVLPTLNRQELNRLANAQRAAAGNAE